MCKVLDANQVLVSGSALKMSPLGRAAVVMVDPQMSAGDLGSCDVTVTSPSGQTIPVRITKTDKFTAEFIPAEVGELELRTYWLNTYEFGRVKLNAIKIKYENILKGFHLQLFTLQHIS